MVAQTWSSSVASIAIVVFGVTVGAISVVEETVVVVVAKEMMMAVTVGTGRPITNVRVRPPG